MNDSCRKCFLDKYYDKIPEGCPEETVQAYQEAFRALLSDPDPVLTAPETSNRLRGLRKEYLGEAPFDFAPVKRHFNALMLTFEEPLEERLSRSEDPLKLALQYAMTGNFIDFAALASVKESKLMELMDRAPAILVEEKMLEELRQEILRARMLTYVTDNCGEIVMDKLLIHQILRMNSTVEVTVIVRGGPAANDATMEDAEQAGLTSLSPRVRCIGSGAPMEGTVFRYLSAEAQEAITAADVVLSKGQGNYETMSGCGFNVFYIFMCKCELFMRRFSVPQFSGILTRDNPVFFLQEAANRTLAQRFLFRKILPEEAEQAAEMGQCCLTPAQFLTAIDRETGRIAGFMTGVVTKEKNFRDEFYTDASLQDPAGDTVMLTALEVLPAYRGQGLGEELIRLYGLWEEYRGRKRLVLQCPAQDVPMYEKLGYTNLGLSASVRDGEPLHEMERKLTT